MEVTSLEEARRIMGRNFIGIGQVEKTLGMHSSGKNRARFRAIPFSREVLEEDPHGTILIAGVGLSISELYTGAIRTNPHLFDSIDDFWFLMERVATNSVVDNSWYLMKRRVSPESLGKTYRECFAMLKEGEVLPRVCEIFYIVLLYYLATHKYLFRGFYPFCQEMIGDSHLLVGFFRKDSNGPPNYLDIRHYNGVTQSPQMGIVSMKKAVYLPESEHAVESALSS